MKATGTTWRLDTLQALKVLADIPIADLNFGGSKTLEERDDGFIICGWNHHKLTVGDVKAARRALEFLTADSND